MRGSRLQSLPILHKCLDRISLQSAGKTFTGRFHAFNDRHGHILLGKIGIYVEHLHSLCLRFFAGSMSRMSFLPKELGRTQEKTCTHFPTQHIGPLVTKNRKVAIRLYPIFIGTPNNRFRCRANNKFFFETCGRIDNNTRTIRGILQPIMSYNGTFFGKTFNVLGLTAQIRLGNKQGEIGIYMSGRLKHIVELPLHLFPYCVSIRLYYHTTAHSRLFGEVGLYDQIVIPLRIILAPFGQLFQFFCHILFFNYFRLAKIGINAESIKRIIPNQNVFTAQKLFLLHDR